MTVLPAFEFHINFPSHHIQTRMDSRTSGTPRYLGYKLCLRSLSLAVNSSCDGSQRWTYWRRKWSLHISTIRVLFLHLPNMSLQALKACRIIIYLSQLNTQGYVGYFQVLSSKKIFFSLPYFPWGNNRYFMPLGKGIALFCVLEMIL